jgi:hypothetical protein
MPTCSRLVAIASALFIAASSQAAIVWDLNPNDQNAPVGSSSHTFTSSGVSITAYGFDNNNGFGTAHELFYKHENLIGGAVEEGLGLTNTSHNELQPTLNFIQFDFTAALAAGMLSGELSVGSVQAGESFAIYGSNTLGTLGTQLTPAFGSAFDNQYIPLPDFGEFLYYSVVAITDDVLPVSIRGEFAPVPEVSAMLPAFALLLLAFAVDVRRRRRNATA